jgi:hypothetical protein
MYMYLLAGSANTATSHSNDPPSRVRAEDLHPSDQNKKQSGGRIRDVGLPGD